MAIDARVSSTWHDVGSSSARISNSWHTITESYQRRNGVWEKVWPAYKDYGGDTPELIEGGYIDKYGYNGSGTGTASQSSIEGYTSTRRNSLGSTVGGCIMDASTFTPQFFATNDVFDARGYNYMAFVLAAYITTNESSSGNRHNFQIKPFISFAETPNVGYSGGVTNITPDSYNSSSVAYDGSRSICTFVDLSNCNVDDLYLRVGCTMGTSWDNSNYNAWGYLDLTRSYCGIWLFKNQSDCTINGSDYDYSWTLTY